MISAVRDPHSVGGCAWTCETVGAFDTFTSDDAMALATAASCGAAASALAASTLGAGSIMLEPFACELVGGHVLPTFAKLRSGHLLHTQQ